MIGGPGAPLEGGRQFFFRRAFFYFFLASPEQDRKKTIEQKARPNSLVTKTLKLFSREKKSRKIMAGIYQQGYPHDSYLPFPHQLPPGNYYGLCFGAKNN